MDNIAWIGIDPSMSCTSITFILKDYIKSCIIFPEAPKYLCSTKDIILYRIKKSSDDIERFDIINSKVIEFLKNELVKASDQFNIENFAISMEGYSYGSTGNVFSIGEFCGIMKLKMFENKIKYDIIAPTTLKKFIGKGNFDKLEIWHKFRESVDIQNGLYIKYFEHLKEFFKNSKKYGDLNKISKSTTPLNDLIDSFYLALLSKDQYQGEKNG
jgi:Holliday junction resolvasome RuvABC endonuclease subunit